MTQSDPSLFRWLKMCVAISVGTSLAAFAFSSRTPALLFSLLVAAAAGWSITEFSRRRGTPIGLPRLAANIILVAMLVASALWVSSRGIEQVVTVFGGLLALIVVLRLWEQRRTRDEGHLLLMSLFLWIGAVLNINDIWVGLLLLVAAPVLTIGTMLFQLCAAAERSIQPAAAATSFDATRSQPRIGRMLGVTSAAVIVLGGSFATAIFILIPRGAETGLLTSWLPRPSRGRVVGFTDTVDLRQGGTIQQSSAAVLDVRVRTADGSFSLNSEEQQYHLRGSVLESYVSGTWVPLRTRDVNATSAQLDRVQSVAVSSMHDYPPSISVEVAHRMVSSNRSPIFSLLRPVTLAITESDDRTLVEINHDTGEIIRSGSSGVFRYVVSCSTAVNSTELDMPPVRRIPEPFPSNVVAEIAADILKGAGLDPDPNTRPVVRDELAIRALETHLRETFTYSLTSTPAPLGSDPTEWFLTHTKSGHCEFYASSLAALCRSIGIDARVVTGYLVAEYDSERGSYTVRQSDAHAWVEAWTGTRWRTIDGTPQSELRDILARERGMFGAVGRWFSSLEDRWNSSIVSFDSSSQARLLGRRETPWSRSGVRGDDQVDAPGWDDLRPWLRPIAWGTAAILCAWGAAALGRWWLLRRRNGVHLGHGWAMTGQSGRLYKRLVRAMRAEAKQPSESLASLVRASGDPRAEKALDALYQARFGGPSEAAAALATAESLINSLGQSVPARN